MTQEEILTLSDDELRAKAALCHRFEQVTTKEHGLIGYAPEDDEGRGEGWQPVPDYPHDIDAAFDLLNEVYKEGSHIYGAVWTLTTSDKGKQCSKVTLTSSKTRYEGIAQGRKINKEDRVEVIGGAGEMARAITLAYVVMMEKNNERA